MTPYWSTNRRSAISCCRNGILSIERESSRTLHGAGLRSATRPSLPNSAIMYPRGRSVVRNALGLAGSVSVMTMTSRSAKASSRPVIRSSCCWNLGSLGVSAKMTKGRAAHCSSDNVTSDPSKIWAWSSCHRSRTVASWAAADVAPTKRAARAARRMFVNAFIILDIEAALRKAKAQGPIGANNFACVPA